MGSRATIFGSHCLRRYRARLEEVVPILTDCIHARTMSGTTVTMPEAPGKPATSESMPTCTRMDTNIVANRADDPDRADVFTLTMARYPIPNGNNANTESHLSLRLYQESMTLQTINLQSLYIDTALEFLYYTDSFDKLINAGWKVVKEVNFKSINEDLDSAEVKEKLIETLGVFKGLTGLITRSSHARHT